MAQFILLLHDRDNDMTTMSPDEIQGIIEEYSAWSRQMAEAGRLVGGHKLTDGDGRDLTGWQDEFSATDSPAAEAKEVIGGLYHIEAADYDEAVELARSCPHLKFGGRIELRQVDLLEEPAG
ncbi:MAG: YciI family protein [Thermoanaerobaculia bacterium]|nr:YciI family protein [Thermoanaerobaculia bacterium]